jgi:hypothetical protein
MTLTSFLLLMSVEVAAAKSAMTLAMTEPNPEPGSELSIEVRWTNIYGKPLRIPANWADELKMWAFRVPPGERPAPQQVSSAIEMSIKQARQLDWITVQPDEVLTHSIPITIEECASGCMGGSYFGQVNLSWGMVDGRRDDQILPEAQIPFNFDVKLPLLVVTAGVVTTSLQDVQPATAEGNIAATVSIQNTSGAPLWMPGPEGWLMGCTLLDKKDETVMMQSVGGQQGALTEDGYQLIAPDAALTVPIVCEGMFEGKLPKKATLSAMLRPLSPFFPVNSHDDRQVLTDMVPSGEPVRVPKK